MGNLNFRVIRIVVMVCLMGIIFGNCGPTEEDKARMTELARVKKIALVCFVGKSKTNPQDTIHEKLTKDMFDTFKKEIAKHSKIIELLPYNQVKTDAAYSQVSALRMPKGAISAVEGLTYIKHGTSQGFDCTPLIESLKVDALLAVITQFGIAVRQNASTVYITADVTATLVTPPEKIIWGQWKRPYHFENQIMISIVDHPKLMGSIGAKWVIFARPSESEYAELTKIAIEKKTPLAKTAGESIVKFLIEGINEARRFVSQPTK